MKRIVTIVWDDTDPTKRFVLRWFPWNPGEVQAARKAAKSLPLAVRGEAEKAIAEVVGKLGLA